VRFRVSDRAAAVESEVCNSIMYLYIFILYYIRLQWFQIYFVFIHSIYAF